MMRTLILAVVAIALYAGWVVHEVYACGPGAKRYVAEVEK